MPTDENALYAWILGGMIGYLAVAYALQWSQTGRFTGKEADYLTRVFDSATFAGSAMLLVGIFVPDVLSLIGNTKPFLIVAGLAGVIYALHALKPRH